jgi:serine/threonine protein kinase
MYELLTSRRLFDGPDALETMMRVKALPIPRPSIANPTVTPELDEIVMTALERDPTRRWQSAAQMRDRLRDLLAHQFPGDRQVASWVSWVFTQERGRVPQMTPVMPAPILRPTPPTIEPSLPSRPGPTPTPPAAPHLPDPRLATSMVNLPTAPTMLPEPRTLAIWIGVAVAVIVLVVVISKLV